MKSEFLTFSQNLKALLKNDLGQRAESTGQNKQKAEKIKNDIADFFDQAQQNIHGIECPALKRQRIRQIQKLITDFSDKLYKNRANKYILLKMSTRLQVLKEKYPAEFNHHYPVPIYIFNNTKNMRRKRVEEIEQHLNALQLDPCLNEILVDYFEFRDHPLRVSSPTWKNLDYHGLLTEKILNILKNTSNENLDLALIRFFVRYNFNLNSINDYYICKIDLCLKENKKNEKTLLKHLFNILQNKPLKNIAYNENFKSLHRDLNDHLKIKLNELEGDGFVLLPPYLPQYNKNAEIRMLFEELKMSIGYQSRPTVLKNLYHYLSEYTRGLDGDKVTPKSYENGTQVKNLQTYDEVALMLKEMAILNEEKKLFSIKKASRLSNRPK